MNEKKVLYLSYDGMTDPLGQSQVLPYLRGLAKEGYIMHLVSYEKPDKFKQHRAHIQHICDESGIHWHPQDYVVGGSLRTTLRQVKRMRKIAFYLSDKHGFSIVHCRSYIAALAGLRMKRKLGTKFVFDMRGFWADERVDGGLWSLKNPLYRVIYNYFKRKELQFLQESDSTISLTWSGKKEIESWEALKGHVPEITVIPCCVDLHLFDPKQIRDEMKTTLRLELGIHDDDFILGYVGSIGTWYMLPEMLDYFRILKKENAKARFMFVSGEKRESIIELAKAKGIDPDDLIITSVLHKDVPLHISLFDKSIFFIRPSYSKKASSPTKQGEIMAMGIPLICNPGVGDTDEIVRKYHSGCIVSNFSDNAYLIAISDSDNFDANEISEGAASYFSLDEGVKQYLRVYTSVHG